MSDPAQPDLLILDFLICLLLLPIPAFCIIFYYARKTIDWTSGLWFGCKFLKHCSHAGRLVSSIYDGLIDPLA